MTSATKGRFNTFEKWLLIALIISLVATLMTSFNPTFAPKTFFQWFLSILVLLQIVLIPLIVVYGLWKKIGIDFILIPLIRVASLLVLMVIGINPVVHFILLLAMIIFVIAVLVRGREVKNSYIIK